MKYLLSLTILLFLTPSVYSEATDEIIVFTQKGCSRCEYTVDYLKKNGVKYIEYPTEDEKNNNKMWSLIAHSAKTEVTRVTMPVIVKDGTAYFSIKHLEEFLEKLVIE